MRAMKASDAVGRRFRVKAMYIDPSDDVAVGDKGTCHAVNYGWDWPVGLDMDKGGCEEFDWRELELVEDGE